jgi:hypothetical protein
MSKQHKWHKEIKAWADGAEIEFRVKDSNDDWTALNFECPNWYYEPFEYRIKQQPKEPQYFYVWKNHKGEIRLFGDGLNELPIEYKYIGKIKLEVKD